MSSPSALSSLTMLDSADPEFATQAASFSSLVVQQPQLVAAVSDGDDVAAAVRHALAHRLPVAPHAGEMSQVHVHLSFWHPAAGILEYIPWIKDHFTDPIRVEAGRFLCPTEPGAGTTPLPGSIARYSHPA